MNGMQKKKCVTIKTNMKRFLKIMTIKRALFNIIMEMKATDIVF